MTEQEEVMTWSVMFALFVSIVTGGVVGVLFTPRLGVAVGGVLVGATVVALGMSITRDLRRRR